MKSQEELQDAADRAFELLERKSPHQLAVELVSMEGRVQAAINACARMQEQRDQLASQIKDATAQCVVMADLLRELREGAEIHLHNCIVCKNEQGIANWTSKLERIDAALAGKLPERRDIEWTDATSTPTAEGYRELQAQHDQLQSRLKATMDALSGAVEAAVAEGRSYRPWRYQAEELLGLHQQPIHYMRDNHTFKRLSDDAETAIEEIVAELDAGFTSGMLCSKRPGFVNIGTNYRQPREEFLSACRDAMLAAAPKPEGGA